MNKLTWEIWTAIIALAIGIISFFIKKYIEWKIDLALKGKIEVLKKAHIERFDAVVHIKGMLAEIDHCINHILEGDVEYVEQCNEWSSKVRRESRSLTAIISTDYVQTIQEATDIAKKYSNEKNIELYERWKQHYKQLDIIGTEIQRMPN